jgi:hypothetical protein
MVGLPLRIIRIFLVRFILEPFFLGLDHRFGRARAFFPARQELAALKQLAGLPKTP